MTTPPNTECPDLWDRYWLLRKVHEQKQAEERFAWKQLRDIDAQIKDVEGVSPSRLQEKETLEEERRAAVAARREGLTYSQIARACGFANITVARNRVIQGLKRNY